MCSTYVILFSVYGIGQNVTVKRTDTRTGEVEEFTRPMTWVERTDVELPRHFRKYAKAQKAGKKWEEKRRSIGRWGPSPKEKASDCIILSFHTTSYDTIPYYIIPYHIPYHTTSFHATSYHITCTWKWFSSWVRRRWWGSSEKPVSPRGRKQTRCTKRPTKTGRWVLLVYSIFSILVGLVNGRWGVVLKARDFLFARYFPFLHFVAFLYCLIRGWFCSVSFLLQFHYFLDW